MLCPSACAPVLATLVYPPPFPVVVSRNYSVGNITAGKLSNVRVMAGSSGSPPYATWPPAYASGAKPSNPWMTAAEAAPAGCVEKQNCPLFQVRRGA